MAKRAKRPTIEQQLAEAQARLVQLEKVQLPKLERVIRDIRKNSKASVKQLAQVAKDYQQSNGWIVSKEQDEQ